MRYFDLLLRPEGDGVHPVDGALAAEEAVTREALLHLDAFGDGTGVLLYRLRGDAAVADRFAADSDDVLAHDLLEADGESFHLYLHVRSGEPAGSLITLCYEYALIIDTPLEFTEGGDVVATVVGQHDMLREALKDAPGHVDISIEQVGQYRPGKRDLLSLLTDRQREVFERAVELGYYDIPRAVNQEDLAEAFDCAPSTIDEHLRKAESKMLSSLVRGAMGQPSDPDD